MNRPCSYYRPGRINVRMIALLAVIALPCLALGWMILDDKLNNGIKNRGEYVEVDLKRLGFFDFNAETDTIDRVPEEYRKLDGQRVMLEGQPYGDQLVYSIAECCFGGPPKVQERVFMRSADGRPKVIENAPSMVRVVGKLHVNLKRDSGKTISIYTINVEKVEPV